MLLGLALGIPPQFLIAMFPPVNGCFSIPTYGSLIAAINFDLSGTTRIGKDVLKHLFMIPGLVATSVAVGTGLLIARTLFCQDAAASALVHEDRRHRTGSNWRRAWACRRVSGPPCLRLRTTG